MSKAEEAGESRVVAASSLLTPSLLLPIPRDGYQRLLATGMPPKLALMACLRRLRAILNTMMETGRQCEVPTLPTP